MRVARPRVLRKADRGPKSARPGGWARLVAAQVRGQGERAAFLRAAVLPMFLCQDHRQGESTDEKERGRGLCRLLRGGSRVWGHVRVWAGPRRPCPCFPLQRPRGLFFRMLLLRSGLPPWLRWKKKTTKNLPAMQETQVQSLGQEASPREGNGNTLQYSCLENSRDKGAWRATVHRVTESRTGSSD